MFSGQYTQKLQTGEIKQKETRVCFRFKISKYLSKTEDFSVWLVIIECLRLAILRLDDLISLRWSIIGHKYQMPNEIIARTRFSKTIWNRWRNDYSLEYSSPFTDHPQAENKRKTHQIKCISSFPVPLISRPGWKVLDKIEFLQNRLFWGQKVSKRWDGLVSRETSSERRASLVQEEMRDSQTTPSIKALACGTGDWIKAQYFIRQTKTGTCFSHVSQQEL